MSRHQANRRRTYGRRQHEVHEREVQPLDRQPAPEPAEPEWGYVERSRMRGLRARFPLGDLMGHPPVAAGWRVAADGRLPGGSPAASSPSRGARRSCTSAPAAGRAGWASSWAAIVVAFLLGFFSLAQTVRAATPATTSTA